MYILHITILFVHHFSLMLLIANQCLYYRWIISPTCLNLLTISIKTLHLGMLAQLRIWGGKCFIMKQFAFFFWNENWNELQLLILPSCPSLLLNRMFSDAQSFNQSLAIWNITSVEFFDYMYGFPLFVVSIFHLSCHLPCLLNYWPYFIINVPTLS
jgi:hypothetical protein